jgi:Tfp pilus assembly protein PilO
VNTQTHRIVSVLMVALMVAAVAAGWFLVAQPQLAAAAEANSQLDSVHGQITSSQASLRNLREQETKLPELTAQLTGLQQSIPSTLSSSALVAGIDQQASAAGVHIKDISVDDAAAYVPPVAAGTTGTTGATGTTGGGAATPSPTPTPTPTASASASAAPAGKAQFTPTGSPLITATNFITVPVSITVEGPWDQTLGFVKNLQTGTRLYAVETVGTKQKSDDASQYTSVITGYVFAILDPSSQAAVAAKKAAAAAAATPTPTPTPSATTSHRPAPSATTTPIPSSSPTPSGTRSR